MMKFIARPLSVAVMFGAVAAAELQSGCAMPQFGQKPTVDVAKQRAMRREQAVRQFETQRETAEYHAAMERWTSGDPHTCEAQLRGLVARNPKHADARRALADMALDRGDLARAETELRELLALVPDDAQTHHSLGLLLESTDRVAEARQHLQKAAELAPDNTLFQLCLQNYETQQPAAQIASQPR